MDGLVRECMRDGKTRVIVELKSVAAFERYVPGILNLARRREGSGSEIIYADGAMDAEAIIF